MVYTFIITSPEGDIEECRIVSEREIATDLLIDWADNNNISLDVEETKAEIYIENDDEGEYIGKILDDNVGKAYIIPCEIEEF